MLSKGDTSIGAWASGLVALQRRGPTCRLQVRAHIQPRHRTTPWTHTPPPDPAGGAFSGPIDCGRRKYLMPGGETAARLCAL